MKYTIDHVSSKLGKSVGIFATLLLKADLESAIWRTATLIIRIAPER